MTRRVYLYFAVTFVLGVVLGGAGMFLCAWYGGHWRRPFSKERLVRQITHDLALDPGQTQQLTAIIDESSKKYDALHGEVHPRFVALRDETDDKIRAILTPVQLKKFNEMVEEWRRQHR